MTDLLEILSEVESAGVRLKLDGDKVKIVYPEERQREHLANQVAFLRAHRDEVANWIKSRAPAIPAGVRLLHWNLKGAPIEIESCAIVVDPSLFARTTLQQLAIALVDPKRRIGWSVSQLIDRLGQVGVTVESRRIEEPK